MKDLVHEIARLAPRKSTVGGDDWAGNPEINHLRLSGKQQHHIQAISIQLAKQNKELFYHVISASADVSQLYSKKKISR